MVTWRLRPDDRAPRAPWATSCAVRGPRRPVPPRHRRARPAGRLRRQPRVEAGVAPGGRGLGGGRAYSRFSGTTLERQTGKFHGQWGLDGGQRDAAIRSSKVTGQPAAGRAGHPARHQDELALVERCRQGDLAAFEEVYRTHAPRLYSVACRMLGNATDAEDLLQEIFLAAHRKLDTFRGESALGTWLYRPRHEPLPRLPPEPHRSPSGSRIAGRGAGAHDVGSRRLAEGTLMKMDLERALLSAPRGLSCRLRPARRRRVGTSRVARSWA
jgi:RNA polymerase sigma-70 factor (ECF subfamily)